VAAKRLWVLLAYGQRLIGVALERSLVETPASRSNARRSERSFGSESSIKGSIPTAYWSFCKLLQQEKPAICAAFAEPSDGLEPSTPSLPSTDLACFRGFGRRGICRRLPLVATAGLHKGSILRSHENGFKRSGLAGIALSEERQLNGYRVRLRVVEEYDVALLAESPDDAKARA
jgi:hypothetical protein